MAAIPAQSADGGPPRQGTQICHVKETMPRERNAFTQRSTPGVEPTEPSRTFLREAERIFVHLMNLSDTAQLARRKRDIPKSGSVMMT
jgi:hypothetical protein